MSLLSIRHPEDLNVTVHDCPMDRLHELSKAYNLKMGCVGDKGEELTWVTIHLNNVHVTFSRRD